MIATWLHKKMAPAPKLNMFLFNVDCPESSFPITLSNSPEDISNTYAETERHLGRCCDNMEVIVGKINRKKEKLQGAKQSGLSGLYINLQIHITIMQYMYNFYYQHGAIKSQELEHLVHLQMKTLYNK